MTQKDTESAHAVVLAATKEKAAKASGEEKAELEQETHRLKGKLAARKRLLDETRKVRLLRDCPTSKGRLCRGFEPRLPNTEADKLVGIRAAEELNAA
jgi:hypothetical protein